MRPIGTVFYGEWFFDNYSTDAFSRRLVYRVKGTVQVLCSLNPDGPWEEREELEVIGTETREVSLLAQWEDILIAVKERG